MNVQQVWKNLGLAWFIAFQPVRRRCRGAGFLGGLSRQTGLSHHFFVWLRILKGCNMNNPVP